MKSQHSTFCPSGLGSSDSADVCSPSDSQRFEEEDERRAL